MFGDSHLLEADKEAGVLKRFTMCQDKLQPNTKLIINLALTKGSVKFFFNPHCITGEAVDPDKKWKYLNVCRNDKIGEKSDVAELNHYRNKTFSECYARKFKKTMADVADTAKSYPMLYDEKLFRQYFDRENTNDIENTLARDFLYGNQA